ncbi:uncharacterized protein L3040_003873 [Drepanopeziza brunnea f. sp. 'multigermtubi']|uniref:Vacuolar H+-ATPase assembly protein n=1 Tax=Marssonina brunnea f. sp. multigermtubi (strain MB_m1) TaxID=1072389 RepID=K1X296_MARBU|nr:vacuolar H+-ATPase assembly protein [Drepanopeziza brunnea f. sp. 'multigermtubi' MB_m1]EKD14913.1 vacuolar H+-ATPase assembly protein [Drepanopeziza brunnea f. sp. 'multigermtubi' MB_m1]KAJ5046636.1 hypothetical protein L3040_003873 [Drepanopeziza brunnea f. sp. 'multigermtubi']
MVLLTMTDPLVEALEKYQGLENRVGEKRNVDGDATNKINGGEDDALRKAREREPQSKNAAADFKGKETSSKPSEPALSDPRIGNPISHGQIIELARNMKVRGLQPSRLEDLLKGARVYVPPPPAKPEPTSEYKALMARLRREEEARSYERMTNPPPPMETFSQRFPAASAARAFSSSHQNINASDPDDDGVTYADVDRQVTLIFNVLVSVFACAAAIWIAAKWWSTPARLALSMSGSALIGVAEVVVYSGYLRRVGEAKGKEKKVKEVKEIVKTWVVGAGKSLDEEAEESSVKIESKEDEKGVRARKRTKGEF